MENTSQARLVAFLVAAVAVACAAPAAAQGDDMSRAKEAFTRGQAAFDAGRFEEARTAFEESLEAFPHFRTLFNIGLCAEKLGDVRTAIDMYQRYVDWPSDVPNRDDVSKKIAELKAALPPEPAPAPPEPEVSQPAAAPSQQAPATASQPRRVLLVPGWITAGTGVAGMIVGGVFLGLAHKKKDEMDAVQGEYYDPSVHDAIPEAGKRDEAIGWAAGGAGLAFAVTGAILLIASRHRDGEGDGASHGAPPVAVTPAVATDGAALGVQWSF